MIKKWMWAAPLGTLVVGGVTAAVVGGCLANQNANPYRLYSATPVGNSNTDLIQTYFASIVNGSKLLMLPGYTHTIPLTQALGVTAKSNAPMYNYMNKAGFVLLDDSYGIPVFNSNNQVDTNTIQPVWSTQVASVKFRTDLGSFLTGIAVGEFLNEYQYYFAPNKDDKLTWATYGGATFSSVTGYMGGLQRGIRYFNEHMIKNQFTEDGRAFKPIEQVFLSSEENGNFSNGFGATDGNQLINNLLAKNVSLLVPVAGTQTQQAVRMINQLKKRTIVLGVDTAAENDTNMNLELPIKGTEMINGSTAIGGTNKIIQFSSLKKLDSAGMQILEHINKGINYPPEKDGTIGGFGYQSLGNTKNDCVGVSEAGYPYFIKAVNRMNATTNKTIPNIDKFSETELKEDYKKAVAKIEETQTFKDLDKPENKIYYAFDNWTSGEPLVPGKSWSYEDLPNEGTKMMPLDIGKLDNWFKEDYLKLQPGQSMSEADTEKLNSLKQWFKDNQQEIDIREKFNLVGELSKQNYEKNKSIIKIVTNSPSTPLLDKSFAQSTYMGLVDYWKRQDVNLPVPKG